MNTQYQNIQLIKSCVLKQQLFMHQHIPAVGKPVIANLKIV